MDRIITKEVSAKRKKKIILITSIIFILTITAILVLRYYVNPTISINQVITAKAEVGDVENTLNASGEVLPEFEEVISSPINASVKEVIKDIGNQVKAGQAILSLDKSATESEYNKLGFQIESKENELRKLKLNLSKSFYDIRSNNSIKRLKISNLRDNVAATKRLYKAGGGTKEDIDQAELALKVAELEKQQLENEIKNKQLTMKIEIREAEIELAIQKNDQQELKHKLDLANVIASRAGVITWINKNIGASVQQGEPLVRIANLGSFKIAGNITDDQLEKINNNMSVIVKINDKQLKGLISNISPAIKNGIVSFDIQLEEKNNNLLRPNMKVDVFLITAKHTKVIRVPNGQTFNGSVEQDVFVLKNRKAERRTVKIGLSNFNYVEILNGIKEGEEIITSDMSTYKHVKSLTVKP